MSASALRLLASAGGRASIGATIALLAGLGLSACTGAGSSAAATGSSSSAATSPAATSPTTTTTSSATPSSSARAVVTVPVAAPSSGTINQTVSGAAQTSAAPVPLHQAAAVDRDVSVSIQRVTAIRATARGVPGEIAGPAVSVAVKVANASGRAVDTSSVFVGVTDARRASGIPISGNGSRALPEQLPTGREASGVYVFSLPEDGRSPITVSVSYSESRTILVFTGNVS